MREDIDSTSPQLTIPGFFLSCCGSSRVSKVGLQEKLEGEAREEACLPKDVSKGTAGWIGAPSVAT